MMNQRHSVTAFAPATSANVAVGFDILGFAVRHLGDEVTLVKSAQSELKIVSLSGLDSLPYDSYKNSATVALRAMLHSLNLKQGFDVSIKKNIPLSSGLGGSAASSVAALLALNQFLHEPLTPHQLIEFALMGEEIACGAKHADNVVPCLFGGLTLIQSLSPVRIIQLPLIPVDVVLVHPHLYLATRDSRAALAPTISLSLMSQHNAKLASFISALYEHDYERFAAACVDEVIEPMRAHLIPHFYEVKAAAYQQGALACSISGSGPTLFAFARNKEQARLISEQMIAVFNTNGIQCDVVLSSISTQGATITDEY